MDLNRKELIGRLTADPKQLDFTTGIGASFTVATSYTYEKNGEKVEKATFHNCLASNKLAEIIMKFCKKGSKVYVAGRDEQQTYQKDNGEKKISYQLKVMDFIALDTKPKTDSIVEDKEQSLDDFDF